MCCFKEYCTCMFVGMFYSSSSFPYYSSRQMDDNILQLLLDGNHDEDVLLWMLADDHDGDDGWRDVNFCLDDYSDEECKKMFRFYKQDLYSLCRFLNIPEKILGENNSKTQGIIALCMLLRRLSYPNRLLICNTLLEGQQMSLVF